MNGGLITTTLMGTGGGGSGTLQDNKKVDLKYSDAITDVYPDRGFDGMRKAEVRIEPPSFQSKTVTISTSQTIFPDEEYDALSSVSVIVGGGGGGGGTSDMEIVYSRDIGAGYSFKLLKRQTAYADILYGKYQQPPWEGGMTISVPVRSRYENKYIHIHAALYNGDDFLWTTYDTASGNQPYLVNEASSRCYELIDEYKPPYEDYLAYEFNNNFRFSDISFTSEIVGNYKGKGLSYSADIRIPYDYISKTYNKDGSSESSDSGSSSLRFNVIFGSLPPSLSYKCLTFSDNPSAIYNAVLLASNIDLPYEKRV